ncbi:hypothetical protein [Catelliglobosispora koreensis]|uniref:hypothetical protein n=1 Tax=Catelliglobosispora koreensis TaxID=129052 RepID=UPI000378934B|nr:hypothetical protein [Catelliglobosispora koreensis]
MLVFPATDWIETMLDYPSVTANAGQPGLSKSPASSIPLPTTGACSPNDYGPTAPTPG